jgi:DNA invertase Pin-like site-specific DNA recombinase
MVAPELLKSSHCRERLGFVLIIPIVSRRPIEPTRAVLVEGSDATRDRTARRGRLVMSKALVLGAATFKSLGDPWCDTTTPHGRLMLTVLGGLAEFERHLILARTDEGRKRAQQRGVKFGRKLKLTSHQWQEALARRAAGEALVDIARSYAVSHSTISRLEAGA